MQPKKVIVRCCICGREWDGMLGVWSYRMTTPASGDRCSQGFCNVCYDTEIMKLKLRNSEYAERQAVACSL